MNQHTSMKLFQGNMTTTGLIVLDVFFGVMLAWSGLAFIQYLRAKRLERLPAILGDPAALLDHVANAVGLGYSERYVLKKIAFRMGIPQPVGIILSPGLLVRSAEIWRECHYFTPSRLWGVSRLDHIARQVYGKTLAELRRESASLKNNSIRSISRPE